MAPSGVSMGWLYDYRRGGTSDGYFLRALLELFGPGIEDKLIVGSADGRLQLKSAQKSACPYIGMDARSCCSNLHLRSSSGGLRPHDVNVGPTGTPFHAPPFTSSPAAAAAAAALSHRNIGTFILRQHLLLATTALAVSF